MFGVWTDRRKHLRIIGFAKAAFYPALIYYGKLMKKLVKLVKLNNLQFNSNRDPEVYRRCANDPFRIQALLDGSGQAQCRLLDENNKVLAEKSVSLPGTFTHEISFPTPGIRIVTLEITGNGETFKQDLRLDVMDHAWIG